MRAHRGVLAAALVAAPVGTRAGAQAPADTVRTDTVRTDTARTDTARAAPARADTTAVDSAALADTARREGRRAAERPDTFGRGTLAFLGGVPVGFFGPIVPFTFQEPGVGIPTMVIAGAGAGLVALSATGRAEPPAALAAQAAARGPIYAQAYRDAYAERLRARRQRATLVGGLAGAGTGVALLVLVVSALAHID